jgi:molecular chaperone Hsp33
MTMSVPDSVVQPFYLTGSPEHSQPLLRGRLVRIFDPVTAMLARHGYPDIVSGLCAETVALAGCLAATLKFDGVFTVQAKGNQAVKTLFADVTSDGHIRAYASFDEQGLAGLSATSPARTDGLLGEGYIAFTVDQDASVSGEKAHRYQGIVELAGGTLGDCATQWFRNSEQLATSVMTMAVRTQTGWLASALMLQKIAEQGGDMADDAADGQEAIDEDDLWQTAKILQHSARPDELTDAGLSATDILFRLFHAHGVHVQPPLELVDRCRCSDEKVEMMLAGLSADQRASVADEAGRLVVNCEFCKAERIYDLASFQD